MYTGKTMTFHIKMLFLSIISLLGGVSMAQVPVRYDTLENVVITAKKYQESTMSTGKYVSVISEHRLKESQSSDLAQLLNESGLTINGAYSNPSAIKSVFLRGASTKYTVILLDGIPLRDPSGGGGTYDIRMIPQIGLSRIEIMKGSQSTLYGADASAGVINLTTQDFAKRSIQLNGYTLGGNLGTFQGKLGVEGTLNSQSDWNLAYRIDYEHRQSDGINEVATRPGTVESPQADTDGFSQHTSLASVQLSKRNFSIRPFIRHSYYQYALDQGAFTDAEAYDGRNDFFVGGLQSRLQYSPKGEATLKFSQQHSFRGYTNHPFTGNSTFRGTFRFAELFIRQRHTEQLHYLTGIDYRYEQLFTESASLADPQVETTAWYSMVYAQPLRKLPLHLEIGGRISTHTRFKEVFTYDVNPFVQLSDHLKVYASYATAFRAPSLSDLYGQFGGNTDLKPETTQSIELGIHRQPRTSTKRTLRIGWQAALFQRVTEDVIIYHVTDPTTFAGQLINRDKQSDEGFELGAKMYIGQALALQADYAYVYGEITEKIDEQAQTTYNLIRRPQHTYRLAVDWYPMQDLLLRSHIQALGRRTDTDFSTFTTIDLSPYTLVGFYASYTFHKRPVSVFLDVKNLLNQDNYVETVGYNVPGTRAFLGVKWNF